MNDDISTLLSLALFLVVPLGVWVWLHNGLVTKEESTLMAWAQVESNYQRRADLVPALVETVNRYLKHESETLDRIVKQRAEAMAQLDALGGKPPRDPAELAALAEAQAAVGAGVRALIAVAENYPELRSADQFLHLQAQLEGGENRINVARLRFNEAVRAYNAALRKLPGSLVASVGGFERKVYFEADAETQDAPSLAFE